MHVVKGGSRFEIRSAGFNDGNFASLKITNDMALTKESSKRGMNIIALDGPAHKVIFQKTYDTNADKGASDEMVRDIKQAAVGSVIIATVRDEATQHLSQEAKNIFVKMGSKEIKNLGFQESWAFVGIITGGSRTVAAEKISKAKAGPVAFALSMGYTKVTKKVVKRASKVKGGSRFEVSSSGFSYTKQGTSVIKVNGEQVNTSDDQRGGRGLNVVALDGVTHKVLLKKSYDTAEK